MNERKELLDAAVEARREHRIARRLGDHDEIVASARAVERAEAAIEEFDLRGAT